MAERSQYQYTPIQGPVWREPVAEKMQWLPEGQQPARGLTPNSLGSYARPEFAALYVPAGLQWYPSDRYSGQRLPYSLVRSYILDPIPPEDPRRLEWVPQDRYFGRSLPRSALDWSVYPQLVAAPVFDPQDLEWVPKGVAPQVPLEFRRAGDFAQPAFEALYKPERLEWLLEGQQPARAIPFIWQGSWVCDPTTPTPIVFDPQFFPFQATDLVRSLVLPQALQGDFSTPPLPPGPDVIPTVSDLGAKWPVRATEFITKIKNRFYWFRDESELPEEPAAPLAAATKIEAEPVIAERIESEIEVQSAAEIAKRKRIQEMNEAIMKLFI